MKSTQTNSFLLSFVFCSSLAIPLASCAGTIFGVPTLVATEVAPRAVNGKGLAEDGADAVTGKDCRLIEGTIHKDRKICENKDSPATQNDFKGAEGLITDNERQ